MDTVILVDPAVDDTDGIAVHGLLHDRFDIIAGLDAQALSAMGVTALFAAVHCARPLEWQLAHAKENLRFAARQLFSLMAALGGEKA